MKAKSDKEGLSQVPLDLPLQELIPLLYRYQFHLNSQVATWIRVLFKRLLSASGNSVDSFAPAILRVLQSGLQHSGAAIRETSLIALAEALKTFEVRKSAKDSEVLWDDLCKAALKLLDDVHDSVRIAAIRACTNLCTTLSPSLTMPFILDSVKSETIEVHKFSLNMIKKLLEVQPNELLPYVGDLIQSLLEVLSSLEPQILNYMSFHVHKYDMDPVELDAKRLTLLRESPVMRNVENLLELACSQGKTDSMIQALANVVRKGVGLLTRGGTARAILGLKKGILTSEAADELLKSLSGAIFDANLALRHAMASAVAHVIGIGASDNAVCRFCAHLTKQYLNFPERRDAVATTVLACAKSPSSLEVMSNLMDAHLPLTSLGFQTIAKPGADSASSVEKKKWETAWQIYVHSESSAVKLYASEIKSLAVECLKTSKHWDIQDQSAKVLFWLVCSHSVPISPEEIEPLFSITETHRRDVLVISMARIAEQIGKNFPEHVKDHTILVRVRDWTIEESVKKGAYFDLIRRMAAVPQFSTSRKVFFDPLMKFGKVLASSTSIDSSIEVLIFVEAICSAFNALGVGMSSDLSPDNKREMLKEMLDIVRKLLNTKCAYPTPTTLRFLLDWLPKENVTEETQKTLLHDIIQFPKLFTMVPNREKFSSFVQPESLNLIAEFIDVQFKLKSSSMDGIRSWIQQELNGLPATTPSHVPDKAWKLLHGAKDA
jgi:hypothetical protein